MDGRSILRFFISPWVIGGTLIVGFCMFTGTLLYLFGTRTKQNSLPAATAILQVIPVPTFTPTLPPPTPSPELTATLPVPPASGNITVGSFVQVTGTGGDGLRLRSDPGLNGTPRFLGMETEVFQVSDGPRQADGYTWWLLVAPYDSSVQGWAVANYLVVEQNPN